MSITLTKISDHIEHIKTKNININVKSIFIIVNILAMLSSGSQEVVSSHGG